YGGLANTWDYGPLGMALKNNIKAAWLKKFVQENKYNVGLDAAILMNPQTWVASGHVGGFSDPKMDCKECKTRHRADDLIEDFDGTNVAGWSNEQMTDYINEHQIPCPNCGKHNFTEIRQFNLMFKTFQGVTEDSKNELYLRPETAQGIFVNFANIARTTRKKLPFGVCQVGKSFRNEITPGNFIFRVREFEQMELEFFCKPGTDLEWFDYWRSYCRDFLYSLGIKEENLRLRDHDPKELAFYSKGTTDFEYFFPFGWGELWGIADRTDYDLNQHIKESGQALDYFDPTDNTRYVPYVIEPSLGVERLFLATVVEAYDEEQLDEKDSRVVMRFHPYLAPFKAAVLPLSKKLSDKADAVREQLSKDFMVDFDDAGSIGKRYRRQDEIGTPFCVTYDFDSIEDGCVTVRDRDTMQQERVKIDELNAYIAEKVKF
ncbi:glycine--tRNA ligase, partial [Lachnoclostridium sp. MSJ-17]|uniref:glycine--tRNA ligase n=1 Tax=Lachnoclostridium sp. MSJ-17 TaxID=2841516 RepID=UPI001C0F9AF1